METSNDTCRRCKQRPKEIVTRSEPFCTECFLKFVQTRVKRSLENYKVDYSSNQPVIPNLVLPLSLGHASVTLLDMCVDILRLQSRQHRGKQGYKLHVIHIASDTKEDDKISSIRSRLETLYPECTFYWKTLADMFESTQSTHVKIREGDNEFDGIKDLPKLYRTGQQDVCDILRRQYIHHVARLPAGPFSCSTVIWGHTQTRLAECVVSMVAKGRGDAIPEFVSPPQSDGCEVLHPLGEILRSEVDFYVASKGLHDLCIADAIPPNVTKLQSIDELISQYFYSVEAGFPAVVSTVVRTALKLASPKTASCCILCGGPNTGDGKQWLDKITVGGDDMDGQGHGAGAEVQSSVICYGCNVVFSGSKIDKVSWPRYDVQDVINEYVL